MKKRIHLLLICFILIISTSVPIRVSAVEIASGLTGTATVAGIPRAPWRLYADGTLVVDSGSIQGNATASPWNVHRNNIQNIVFTGPITAGTLLSRLFFSLPNLISVTGLEYFDTSRTTSTNGMFQSAYNVTSISDLSGWDTSNVTNMAHMFLRARSLTNLNLPWDTGNVLTMQNMFNETDSLVSISGLSGWDTGNVTNMSSMFHSALQLTTLNLATWDTNAVLTMNGMFQNTPSLTTVGNLSNWNTSNVMSIANMFFEARSLINLDVSGWDTSNVSDMRQVFREASSLVSINGIGNWNTDNITTMHRIFCSTISLANLDLTRCLINSRWNTGNVTDFSFMFNNTQSLFSIGDLSEWNTSSATTMLRMFNASGLTTLNVSGWDTSNVITMQSMFHNAANLVDIAGIGNWNTNSVTTMNSMFYAAISLANLDLTRCLISSRWNTGNVTDFTFMFNNTQSLSGVGDLSEWNTSSATTMLRMFDGSGLTTLNVSGWDTSNVTTMQSMFRNASNLTTIMGIFNWDVGNVTSTYRMFNNTIVLASLDLSNWDTITPRGPGMNLPNMSQMFTSTGIREITLGDDFRFHNNNPLLPPVPLNNYFTGHWHRLIPQTPQLASLTSGQLMNTYNGAPMAGTWIWENWNRITHIYINWYDPIFTSLVASAGGFIPFFEQPLPQILSELQPLHLNGNLPSWLDNFYKAQDLPLERPIPYFSGWRLVETIALLDNATIGGILPPVDYFPSHINGEEVSGTIFVFVFFRQ